MAPSSPQHTTRARPGDVRLFVAILPPRETLQRMEQAIRKVRKLAPDAKWATAESAHVLVLYVGETPARRIPKVQSTVRAVAGKVAPFTVHLAGTVLLGESLRVLAVDVARGAGTLLGLHAELRDQVAVSVQPVRERPYRPHMALAKTKERHPGLFEAAKQLGPLCQAGCDVDVREIVLLRSDRSAAGGRRTFSMVERFPLGGSGPVGRHELPDGHDIRLGPGTVQVRARTSTGWQWIDVASNAAACDALSVHALNADIVAPATYELPDGHVIRCPSGFKVQVRGSTGKWLDVATTDEAGAVLADLAREAAKLVTRAGGSELHKLIASAAAHGRESDPEHEIGDLALFIRTAWDRLTQAQQRAFYDEHVPKRSAASRAKGDRIGKLMLHAQDRMPAREVANLHGILTAAWALLTPEQQREVYGEWAADVQEWLPGGGA